MSIESISAISASMTPLSVNLSELSAGPPQFAQAQNVQAQNVQAQSFQTQSFSQLLMQGLQDVENRVANADSIVQKFALDDNVPVHQVAIALEEAQLSVELAMQVRARLLESFRDIMNMQI